MKAQELRNTVKTGRSHLMNRERILELEGMVEVVGRCREDILLVSPLEEYLLDDAIGELCKLETSAAALLAGELRKGKLVEEK